MAYISAVSTIEFPYLTNQQDVKRHFREMFSAEYPIVEQALDIFDIAEISSRNFCQPLEYYKSLHGFGDQNKAYICIDALLVNRLYLNLNITAENRV